MTLFNKKVSYVGVDIGTASIKVVELMPWSGKPRLATYGYIDIATDIIHSKTQETENKIIASLKKVILQSKVSSTMAIAALPTFSVFNSIISLPPMAEKDLTSAIKWEAKKYVPLPLDEMILDWKVIRDLPEQSNSPGGLGADKKTVAIFGGKKQETINISSRRAQTQNLRILVTAAPKNLVNRYITIFKAAGLKLMSLETEAFALARSLIGQDKSTIIIVDIGSITTDICIIEKGVPVLNRSIDIGGLTITKAIASSLNISLDRAEQFKRDFGVTINKAEAPKGINKTIATAMSPIFNEIKYVFDLYMAQGITSIEKIVLSGGSAFLPNLAEYFEQLYNRPAIIGNPWDQIVYPDELRPVLDEVGTRLAVAIGLAMRDIK